MATNQNAAIMERRTLAQIRGELEAQRAHLAALRRSAADYIAIQCPPIVIINGVAMSRAFDIPPIVREELTLAQIAVAELEREFYELHRGEHP